MHSKGAGMNGFLRKIFGDRGERAAAKYLKAKGMKVIARQYLTQWGEIDLIMLDGDTLVFVEVKTRHSGKSGQPSERVDRLKRTNSTKAALAFLKTHGQLGHRARFDVIAIVWPENSKVPDITHIPNAFEAVDLGQMY